MRSEHVFTALGDATRREIVEALARRGPCTATKLASDMPISRQAVAKHLTQLHRARLVAPQRRGRETHYQLTPEPFGAVIAWLEDVCARSGREHAA